jgi:hypothetical protein
MYRFCCIDLAKLCSGAVLRRRESDERRDGRRDQALDGASEVSIGAGYPAGQDHGVGVFRRLTFGLVEEAWVSSTHMRDALQAALEPSSTKSLQVIPLVEARQVFCSTGSVPNVGH